MKIENEVGRIIFLNNTNKLTEELKVISCLNIKSSQEVMKFEQ